MSAAHRLGRGARTAAAAGKRAPARKEGGAFAGQQTSVICEFITFAFRGRSEMPFSVGVSSNASNRSADIGQPEHICFLFFVLQYVAEQFFPEILIVLIFIELSSQKLNFL